MKTLQKIDVNEFFEIMHFCLMGSLNIYTWFFWEHRNSQTKIIEYFYFIYYSFNCYGDSKK